MRLLEGKEWIMTENDSAGIFYLAGNFRFSPPKNEPDILEPAQKIGLILFGLDIITLIAVIRTISFPQAPHILYNFKSHGIYIPTTLKEATGTRCIIFKDK